MNKKIIPLLFLPVLFMIPAFAQQQTYSSYHTIDLSNVTKGSHIINTTVTISMDPQWGICHLILIDSVLNPMVISDNFICEGTHTISLNQIGNDALENNRNIQKNILGIGVQFVKNTNLNSLTTGSFAIYNPNISYKEQTYFAQITDDKISNVIIADQSYIDTLDGRWIETNTNNIDAGLGYTFNPVLNQVLLPIPVIQDTLPVLDNTTGILP